MVNENFYEDIIKHDSNQKLKAKRRCVQGFVGEFNAILEQLHFIIGNAIFGATFQKEMVHKQSNAILECFQLRTRRNPLKHLRILIDF